MPCRDQVDQAKFRSLQPLNHPCKPFFSIDAEASCPFLKPTQVDCVMSELGLRSSTVARTPDPSPMEGFISLPIDGLGPYPTIQVPLGFTIPVKLRAHTWTKTVTLILCCKTCTNQVMAWLCRYVSRLRTSHLLRKILCDMCSPTTTHADIRPQLMPVLPRNPRQLARVRLQAHSRARRRFVPCFNILRRSAATTLGHPPQGIGHRNF